jgi:hypothetical protein
MAEIVATYDPDCAESIIAISDPGHQDGALARIAVVVAQHDPDHAERLARASANPAAQCGALLVLAKLHSGAPTAP